MKTSQVHYGKSFYLDKKTGYWISTSCPKIRAHRWVWLQHHDEIPKGCHIHHKNENKSDNSIENLELMAASDHLRMHMTEEKRKRSSVWAGEIRHLTKEWHASEEGRLWHKLHALKNKFGKNEPRDMECEVCGSGYKTTKLHMSRFCTNACKSVWRRNSGLDDSPRKCKKCNQEFICNKYAKTLYCSRSCANKLKI
jgi:hypothetical protein